jgi:hypothetical protein
MQILIFKTNIGSRPDFIPVKNFLNMNFNIYNCTIDLEDSDRVLRVVGENLNTNEVQEKVTMYGFSCEELPD